MGTTGVYGIKNEITGRTYVGSSLNIEARWTRHREGLNGNRHYNAGLQRDWIRLGEGAFTCIVLEATGPGDLASAETRWAVRLREDCGVYNQNVICGRSPRTAMKVDGDKIRQLRERRLISQENLAKAAGMSEATLNRIERGLQQPRLSTIAKLMEALQADVSEIMEDDL